MSIETVTKQVFETVEKGDQSKIMGFNVPFCFGEGYGGDFR
jgi:hypothetical protein